MAYCQQCSELIKELAEAQERIEKMNAELPEIISCEVSDAIKEQQEKIINLELDNRELQAMLDEDGRWNKLIFAEIGAELYSAQTLLDWIKSSKEKIDVLMRVYEMAESSLRSDAIIHQLNLNKAVREAKEKLGI